ncbi:hypothetical protein Ccrd_014277 [Cynara cardunculus var. scolymus]|uniref:Uncharacterized protein n=1 Tax=Cynara cardunculus var. scolymus TaxID=59895 RepID=A0A103YE17_CYNCS|nr:hypothetical protein Ccrd_014277 [Cynara cardunculus var. scolymus]
MVANFRNKWENKMNEENGSAKKTQFPAHALSVPPFKVLCDGRHPIGDGKVTCKNEEAERSMRLVLVTSLLPVATMNSPLLKIVFAASSPAIDFTFSMYSLNNSICSSSDITDYGQIIARTASSDVRGSYPPPPEAKFTPVSRSSIPRLGSRYGRNTSLIPSSSTALSRVC